MFMENTKQTTNKHQAPDCAGKLHNDTIDTRGFGPHFFVPSHSLSHSRSLLLSPFIFTVYIFCHWMNRIDWFLYSWFSSFHFQLSFSFCSYYFFIWCSCFFFFSFFISFWKLMLNICNIFQLYWLCVVYPHRTLFVHTRPNQIY